MFILGGQDFPRSGEQFLSALNDGLKLFGSPRGATIEGDNFPRFEKLRIDLTGGRVLAEMRPSEGVSDRSSGVSARRLEVVAEPIRFEESAFQFHLGADEVQLDFQRNSDRRPVLTLAHARNGRLDAEIPHAEFEAIVGSIAKAATSRHDVAIQKTDVKLESFGPRAIGLNAEIIAQKLFMKALVRLAGRLDIDDDLVATLSHLSCEGSGMIGVMASGFIQPHLAEFEGRRIPLSAFPLGEIKIRNLSVEVGEALRLRAEFSS